MHQSQVRWLPSRAARHAPHCHCADTLRPQAVCSSISLVQRWGHGHTCSPGEQNPNQPKKKNHQKTKPTRHNQPHTRPTPRRAFPSCLTGLWHLPWPHSKRGPLLALPDRSQEGSQDHLSPQHCHVAGVIQLLAQGFTFKPTRCTLQWAACSGWGKKKPRLLLTGFV